MTLIERSVARIIRHGHPHGYPYGYPSKWFIDQGYQYECQYPQTIYMDIHAISAWISNGYPHKYPHGYPYGYPYRYPHGYPCPIIRAANSSTRGCQINVEKNTVCFLSCVFR